MNENVNLEYSPNRNDYNKILINDISKKILELQKAFIELEDSIKKTVN
jgi:hypothetical protein